MYIPLIYPRIKSHIKTAKIKNTNAEWYTVSIKHLDPVTVTHDKIS